MTGRLKGRRPRLGIRRQQASVAQPGERGFFWALALAASGRKGL